MILDCDPGHDDAVAIMLAAAHNDIEILGITCVAGNATLENTRQNALKICSLIGRSEIPIFSGSEKPLICDLVTAEHVHGKSGLDTDGEPIKISEGYNIEQMHAVDFIIDTCHKQNEPIYLCPVGPLTNIALALKKDPSIKPKIKEIVFMGGAAMCLGNITPVAEFNIYVDPHAANIVLNSGVKTVMFGLDVTHKVNVNDMIINDIKGNQNQSSILFADLMNFYSKTHREVFEINESPLHDPCVIGYLIDQDLFSGKFVNVQVEELSKLTRGKTVTDWVSVTDREPNCHVMIDADSEKFFSILKSELKKLN
ncbi:nucleoside hydrolase [Alphaproteobacteria bacterium]|nr:nucleoside hydrolase [Alphaproteobacteria bacterium]